MKNSYLVYKKEEAASNSQQALSKKTN